MNSRIRREALEHIVGEGDRNCIWELRMNTNAFANLCELLEVQGGLNEDGHVSLPEQVATFLIILAHHKKNHSLQVRFCRSGETVSKYFNKVLKAVIHIQSILFAKATPVEEDCLDPTWRRFKGCLGALDGTYIEVTVPESEKAKYRKRKGKICTNVLRVCNWEMGFVYPLKIQSQIIIACCLLQNFIRKSMGIDPKEEGSILDEFMPDGDEVQDVMIDVVENTNEWTHWRDNIATEIYEEWRTSRME
ncbi:hypothetical protein AAHE18_U036700 [Arachis hypogaea]